MRKLLYLAAVAIFFANPALAGTAEIDLPVKPELVISAIKALYVQKKIAREILRETSTRIDIAINLRLSYEWSALAIGGGYASREWNYNYMEYVITPIETGTHVVLTTARIGRPASEYPPEPQGELDALAQSLSVTK